MAHLFRLIAGALFLLAGVAHAAVPTVTQYRYVYTTTAGSWAEARAAACSGALNAAQAYAAANNYTEATTVLNSNGIACQVSAKNTAGTVVIAGTLSAEQRSGVCPTGSTLVGGSCQCTSPYVQNATATACLPPPNDCVAKMGQSAGIWRYDGGYGAQPNPLASEICKQPVGGVRCVVKVADPVCTQGRLQGVGSAYWFCRGDAFYTGGYGVGSACDRSAAAGGDGGTAPSLPEVTITPPPDELPPNTAAPTTCPVGTFEGTVNGTHTCVENLDAPSSGSSPQTGQTSVKNPDGSTTTTTTTGTTTCAQGVCTTTNNISSNITNNPASTCPQGTTPSGPGGSASSCTGTSTNSTTQAQSEFCKANPKDKQCAGSGTGGFAGSCASGFVATGEDPVLNAMAKEQYTRNCETLRTDTEPSTWIVAEGQKTGNAMDGNPNNGTVNIGPGNFDQSDALGGGGCSLNKTVVVRGFSVALPFNVLCDPLAVLGQILVAVSLLLAARIVTRG